ncbi:MAG: DUF4292 domain-containing protein [Bacteroidales bacterium]|nr:DUF4292 domain-containing protein [Bacteroidales bacterium]
MRHFLHYIYFIVVIGIATSCSSNRNIVRVDNIQAFTARCNIRINESNHSTSISGSLRFRKDDVIQILFTPIFGMEAARLEISPDDVFLIDRMNKQFIRASYGEIRAMSGMNLNYKKIQKLFLRCLTLSNEEMLSEQHVTLPINNHLELDLSLTNFAERNDWTGHSTVSDKYREIEISELTKLLPQHQ